jgi:hypothetical protein
MHDPNKPARENLLDLLDRLKTVAHEAAAAPGTEHHQQELLFFEMLLSASVARLIRTASDRAAGHLEGALLAAFMLGSMVPADLQATVAKRLQTLRKEGAAMMRDAKQKRHPEWPRIKEVIDRELELGSKPKQIARMLAAEGLHLEYATLRKRIERHGKLKAR